MDPLAEDRATERVALHPIGARVASLAPEDHGATGTVTAHRFGQVRIAWDEFPPTSVFPDRVAVLTPNQEP